MVYCLISITAQANSLPINVYLKLTPNNRVITLIEHFNQSVAQNKLASAYHIEPYIRTHPLHITLYLATYEEKQINAIIKQTKRWAKEQQKIKLITEEFNANPSGYVMLTVKKNDTLQQLSNHVLLHLAKWRDKDAPIPQWAEKDKKRQVLFKQWGSPSVMDYYQPHFSIFAPDHLNSVQRAALYPQLQRVIKQFSNKNQMRIEAKTAAIGVGIADSQGQIVKELASFALN